MYSSRSFEISTGNICDYPPSFVTTDLDGIKHTYRLEGNCQAAKARGTTAYNNYRGSIKLLSVLNHIMLEWVKASVVQQLHDHQAGFRKDRPCQDQNVTLLWNSRLQGSLHYTSTH